MLNIILIILFFSKEKTKNGRIMRHIIEPIILNINCDFRENNFFFIKRINCKGILKSLFKRGNETEGFNESK